MEEDNVQILEAVRMKTDKMCSLEKIR